MYLVPGMSMSASLCSRTWRDSGSIYSIYKNVPSGDDDDDDNRSDKAGGKSNSILTQFIKHMNKATLNTVMIAIINTIVMLTQDFANLPVCHKNI